MKHFFVTNQIRMTSMALALFFCAESKAQVKLIHYWDMNNTLPAGGAGGTNLSPLNAEYSTFAPGSAYLSLGGSASATYTLDNGSGGSTLNEYAVLGNDTGGTSAGNLYIRARNPLQNVPFYWHLPTTNYENVVLTFASELSSAGKAVLSYSYSLDGGTTYSTTSLPITSYTPGTSWSTSTIDLSSIAGVNNNPNFIFVVSNILNTTGNYRFDNIALSGDTVTVSSVATGASCFGAVGSATVTPSGTGPYTYTWIPSGGNAATAASLVPGIYTVSITDTYSITATTTVAITQPAALTASITASTNVSCFGLSNGVATVLASGGTATYTYSWSNNQTSATATNLSATGAQKLIYYWDMNSTLPSGGAGGTTVSPLASEYPTSGRTAYLVFDNGTASILDNGSGGATVNEFNVLGNDTGGTSAGNLYIRARNPSYNVPFYWYMPTTNYKNIKLSYAAELSSAGKGAASYSYSLDSGLTYITTGLPLTSYTPGITWATVSIDLSSIAGANNNPKFVFKIINSVSTATTTSGNCRFDNIALQGDTITAGPTYTVLVTDANGCKSGTTITIDQPKSLAIDSIKVISGNDVTVYPSGGIPIGSSVSYTYSWTPGGATAATISGTPGLTYTACVTSGYGCGTVCGSIAVPATTGIVSVSTNDIKVYPVPSKGEITVELDNTDYQAIKVYNNSGKEIYSQLFTANDKNNALKINLSNQPNSTGIFMLQLITLDGAVINKRIIVLNN